MKELTTQTGIIVKCRKTAIEFFQNAQSVDFFSALEIPKEFQDIAVEFYDLIMENDHLAALLGCRGNYDIAIQIDEVTGTIDVYKRQVYVRFIDIEASYREQD